MIWIVLAFGADVGCFALGYAVALLTARKFAAEDSRLIFELVLERDILRALVDEPDDLIPVVFDYGSKQWSRKNPKGTP